ncbi:MAG: hypothetical protein JNK20_07140 [Flavipsychrobacter sp.]|nr:hypothetical protein [Flavipsychrobacter sp.]
MKHFFFILLTLIAVQCTAQSGQPISIPGTKCTMIPPEGFTLTNRFRGFIQTSTGASIMLTELPAPYQELSDGFTVEALRTKGMELISKRLIDLNGSKATMIVVTQTAQGISYKKQMLLLGDSSVSVIVNGIYPADADINENLIEKALLTTRYNKTEKVDPQEAALYTISLEGSAFKPYKYLSGVLLYTEEDQLPTKKPTLMIGNSLSKVTTTDLNAYATSHLLTVVKPNTPKIIENNQIKIDGLTGIETIAEIQKNGKQSELIYHLILFTDDDDYFLIMGNSIVNFPEYTSRFKNIARTFKRK